jgi:hypothetical protein
MQSAPEAVAVEGHAKVSLQIVIADIEIFTLSTSFSYHFETLFVQLT